MPTSARGERGRAVDAVADHHDVPQLRARLQRPDDLDLLLRRPLGVDAIDAERASDPVRSLGPVTRHDGDVRHPDRTEARDELPGVCPSPVRQQHDPRGRAVDGDEDLRGHRVGPGRQHRPQAVRAQPRGAADEDLPAVDSAFDPVAAGLLRPLRRREAQALPLGSRREILAEGERPSQRHERDRVDADVAAQQGPRHRDRQRRQQESRRSRPDHVGRPVAPEEVERGAGEDAEQGRQRGHVRPGQPCPEGGGNSGRHAQSVCRRPGSRIGAGAESATVQSRATTAEL
jgi:hypothetical protein